MMKLTVFFTLLAVFSAFNIKENQNSLAQLGDMKSCIEKNCSSEYSKCKSDLKCISTMRDCSNKCGETVTCWQQCVASKGDSTAKALFACAEKYCFNTTLSLIQEERTGLVLFGDSNDCVTQKCSNQVAACIADPKCIPALQDCGDKCQDNTTCWHQCLASKGSQPAVVFFKCIEDNCYEQMMKSTQVADPTDCIKEKCPSQYETCTKDPKCIPALQDCEKKCGTSKSCWTFCLPGKGSQAAIDTAKCAAANGCVGKVATLVEEFGFEQCMSASCSSHVSNCLTDKLCRFYLLHCKVPERMWEFDMECLSKKAVFSPKLNSWYHCGGKNKCL